MSLLRVAVARNQSFAAIKKGVVSATQYKNVVVRNLRPEHCVSWITVQFAIAQGSRFVVSERQAASIWCLI